MLFERYVAALVPGARKGNSSEEDMETLVLWRVCGF